MCIYTHAPRLHTVVQSAAANHLKYIKPQRLCAQPVFYGKLSRDCVTTATTKTVQKRTDIKSHIHMECK